MSTGASQLLLVLPGTIVTLAGVGAAFLLRLVSVARGWGAPRSPWS